MLLSIAGSGFAHIDNETRIVLSAVETIIYIYALDVNDICYTDRRVRIVTVMCKKEEK